MADHIPGPDASLRAWQSNFVTYANAYLAALGLTVRQQPGPIGPPTTAPICSIECGNRLQQVLRFVDSATPTRRGKPAGVLGVEIWNKVGTTPPTGEGDLRFVAVDTSAPYVMNFDAGDGAADRVLRADCVGDSGVEGDGVASRQLLVVSANPVKRV